MKFDARALRQFVSARRWPMFVIGILMMSITAQGIMVFIATRPNSPQPIEDYYDRSLAWDAEAAVIAASRDLGWRVKIDIPQGKQYAVTAQRPVDVTIVDRSGQPVTGLIGQLHAERPADTPKNSHSYLIELPHAPGTYRTLARLAAPGLWTFNLDTRVGKTRFVDSSRVVVPDSGRGAND